MSNPTTQRRTLKEHDTFFITTMLRQAGTLSKAGLEGIMNSVDSYFKMRKAGQEIARPVIEMTLSATTMKIVDYGLGLTSEEEILEVWEMFGTPHEEDALGRATDTTFGKFRMGRGQLFAFGKNTWRTRTFEMKTDIKKWAREYDLTSGLPDQEGCVVEVELYQPLSLRAIQDTTDKIAQMAQYIDIDLIINGEKRNTPPPTLKWEIETDDVYINKKNASGRAHWGHGLEIYQQGVFVQAFDADRFGIEGVVVTKGELQLNGARNEVMEAECETWKRIRKFLKAEGIKQATRKKRLSSWEARNFLEEYSGGEESVDYEKFFTTSCLADVAGKLWSPQKIAKLITTRAKNPAIHRDPDGRILVGFAPYRDKAGTLVLQRKLAIVLDESILAALRVDHLPRQQAEETAIRTIAGMDAGGLDTYDRFNGMVIRADYEKLLDAEDDLDYHRLGVDAYNEREKTFLRCANEMLQRIHGKDHSYHEHCSLRLGIGESSLAKAWTDGETYICFSRRFVSGLQLGLEHAWHEVSLVLARFYCHKDDSTDERSKESESLDYLRDLEEHLDSLHWIGRMGHNKYRKILARLGSKMPKQAREGLHIEAEAYALEQMVWGDDEKEPEMPRPLEVPAASGLN